MLIRHKLLLSSTALALLTGVAGFLSLGLLSDIKVDLEQDNADLIPHAAATVRMTDASIDANADYRNWIRQIGKASGAASTDAADLAWSGMNAHLQEFDTALRDCRTVIRESGLKLALAQHDEKEIQGEYAELKALDEFEARFRSIRALLDRSRAMAASGSTQPAVQMQEDIEPDFEALRAVLREYRKSIVGEMGQENQQIATHARHAEIIILVSTGLLLAIAISVSVWVRRSISRPIGRLQAAVEQIGRGHLTVQVAGNSRDELGALGRAFNQMTNDLAQTTVSRDYVDDILRSMEDLLVVTDDRLIIQRINPALLKKTGYGREELIGQSIEMILKSARKNLAELPDPKAAIGTEARFETACHSREGADIPVSLSISALQDSSGGQKGLVWIAQDIRSRKESELALEKTHRQLLQASRQAGMAEVATSVLHNVGNVLNSINVSTTLVSDTIKKSRLNGLARLASVFHEQRDNLAAYFTSDPKGKQIPDYVRKLAEHLTDEQALLLKEIGLTRKHLEHVKEIVVMQQGYAKLSGLVEKVKVVELIEDALRMNSGALVRHDVSVVRDFPADAPDVLVEKHKVLQILVNLIRNAKYACDDAGRADKLLTLSVRQNDTGVSIGVQDNGIGIPAENMDRIFNHGFTTRKDGHGFGLHSGALAAGELGGSLTAQSDGPGTGARFTLELPLTNKS